MEWRGTHRASSWEGEPMKNRSTTSFPGDSGSRPEPYMGESRRLLLVPLSTAILALLGGIPPIGVANSAPSAPSLQLVARAREEENEPPTLLLVPAQAGDLILTAGHRSHRSHSSHRSHYSHRSGHASHYSATIRYRPSTTPSRPARRRGGSGGGKTTRKRRGTENTSKRVTVPRPSAPKPARVSFLAYPGGTVYVDGKKVGRDFTSVLKLKTGMYTVVVKNKYLGETTKVVEVKEGQTGVIVVKW